MIVIRVHVTTVINKYAVQMLSGIPATWEGVMRVSQKELSGDRFIALNPNGPARVRLGFDEKISGRSGTYSSINVSCEVEVRCDQTEAQIAAAKALLRETGLETLDQYVPPALAMLETHTSRQG
jgi:hypothetical protein